MAKQVEEVKYKRFWLIGVVLSAILHFSGIIRFYIYYRKRVLKRYRTIILTYHRIRDDSKDSHISVSTKDFESQMVYLKEHFNIISLDTLVETIEKKTDRLMDNVAITFDDGYKDNFLNAYPILKKHRLPATIFLVSKLVGKSAEMLNVDDIKLMKSDGIYFGSHTRTHKTLTEIDINTATEEIHNSKTELECLLNDKIDFFAYPRGKRRHFNNHVKAQVKKSGYKAAFTTENGEIDNRSDLFELKRIGIRNCPLFVFKTRVSGIFESRLVYAARKVLKLT
jgi:peptidoglycan/xylan/chitin deacetylase (PgdA/CDA1 family)